MDLIPCDIVLLPSPEAGQKAISLSKQLERYGSRFTLKGDKYVPHVSLYMVRLKQSDLGRVKMALAGIAAITARPNLTARHYYQSHGYIDIEYRRTGPLDALQAMVIQAVNPLREGLLENDTTRMQNATGQVLENFTRYGYPAVGDLFRPHLTFTRFVTDAVIPLEALPQPHEFNCLFPRLGLFEMDDDNACVRKLAEFTLEGKV